MQSIKEAAVILIPKPLSLPDTSPGFKHSQSLTAKMRRGSTQQNSQSVKQEPAFQLKTAINMVRLFTIQRTFATIHANSISYIFFDRSKIQQP